MSANRGVLLTGEPQLFRLGRGNWFYPLRAKILIQHGCRLLCIICIEQVIGEGAVTQQAKGTLAAIGRWTA